MSIVLESIVTCPDCGARKIEIMPTNACLYFYDCVSCKTPLRPKPGHCCVFCSYGSMPCPPIQSGAAADRCCTPEVSA